MTYEWTDTMGRANAKPELEAAFRLATIAATAFLEQADTEGREPPLFSGGVFASPKNETAQDMAALVDAAIAEVAVGDGVTLPTGAIKAGILTFAVRAAHVVRQHGFGEKGWAELAARLRHQRPGRPERRAAPTPP
jgi:hypothetical protein